jgi:hypothetical protein
MYLNNKTKKLLLVLRNVKMYVVILNFVNLTEMELQKRTMQLTIHICHLYKV